MARDDVEVAAASAPAARRLRGLVDWVGAGRPLTQTGRLRRADALALVEALETGDVLDPRFPIQSSGELAYLSLLVEWAKACRLVRVAHGRIVTVRKHAALVDRPRELVGRMLETLPLVGGELGHSVVTEDAIHTVEAVLAELAARDSLAMEHLCEVAWSTAMSRYWFPDATREQMGWQRRCSDRDVRAMLGVLAELNVLSTSDETVALTVLGKSIVRPWLGLGTPGSPVLCVRVTLEESADPVIWRRLRVPADMRLDRFHQVVAAAMGWRDYHLHMFERGADRFGHPDPELDVHDEREMTVGGLLVREGDRLDYTYDFGDDWRHDLVLESIETEGDDGRARCVAGGGRCPPEDVGGTPGYLELRRILADPQDSEHEHMLEWLGIEHASDFDAAGFVTDDDA
ncbi:MAG: plasmid pRiA4b ORF-3 family protein [Solirubrobacteraceae bacterium MAG38_C4-C5]|nr:plasmid pRiA4b ORF-3 family protein [Candidatus Siliceabacter maunaloa]